MKRLDNYLVILSTVVDELGLAILASQPETRLTLLSMHGKRRRGLP
jgi:hypothetical protein